MYGCLHLFQTSLHLEPNPVPLDLTASIFCYLLLFIILKLTYF